MRQPKLTGDVARFSASLIVFSMLPLIITVVSLGKGLSSEPTDFELLILEIAALLGWFIGSITIGCSNSPPEPTLDGVPF